MHSKWDLGRGKRLQNLRRMTLWGGNGFQRDVCVKVSPTRTSATRDLPTYADGLGDVTVHLGGVVVGQTGVQPAVLLADAVEPQGRAGGVEALPPEGPLELGGGVGLCRAGQVQVASQEEVADVLPVASELHVVRTV